MKFFIRYVLSLIAFATPYSASATVIVTHGMGTSGIEYYQKSHYIDFIKASAKGLGHSVKTITWFSAKDPNGKYAGLLPKERIRGALKIAKKILDERHNNNTVILIGHGYGGQVMRCACRLLNPSNKTIEDSFVYDLIQIIKTLVTANKTADEKLLKPSEIIAIIATGWQITQGVINAIEAAHVVNENLIKFIKQNISFSTTEEIKYEWAKAFDEITKYKKQLFPKGFKHHNAVTMLYTIGTIHNGQNDSVFSEDMDVIEHYINFYSNADNIPTWFGNRLAPLHERTSNLSVFIEPDKNISPTHAEFSGNLQMGPWLLLIPNVLKAKQIGNFENFEWKQNGEIYFFKNKNPQYKTT